MYIHTHVYNMNECIWICRKRDDQIVVIDEKRMEGGNVESTALKINEVSREDLGNYTCELQNEFGAGVSFNSIYLDVHCKYRR